MSVMTPFSICSVHSSNNQSVSVAFMNCNTSWRFHRSSMADSPEINVSKSEICLTASQTQALVASRIASVLDRSIKSQLNHVSKTLKKTGSISISRLIQTRVHQFTKLQGMV